jgi:hypothetical protein
LVNQGERNASFAQSLDELGDEPVLIADFDGEFVVLRQLFQERAEPGKKIVHAHKRFLVEIPELKKQRPEFLPERVHHLQELRHVIIAVHEHLLILI